MKRFPTPAAARWIILATLYSVLPLLPQTSRAQVGDTTYVNYPNWKSSDKVVPSMHVSVTYDSVAGKWHYSYTVSNDISALQDINKILMTFNGATDEVAGPPDWTSYLIDTAVPQPGASFMSLSENFVTVPGGRAAAAGPSQIAPGQTLSGFGFVSPYPPGDARTYIRGYSAVPDLPDSVEDEYRYPDDTTDAQRGWTLAPTRYTRIVTQGTQEPTDLARSNRFLSFMNVDTVGTVLRAPAVIAVKFDNTSGDLPIRSSFRALLNGVDVTSEFHPGPADGADLVAVFELGTGKPLVLGSNTLKTFVTGLPSTFGVNVIPSPVDVDTIIFSVVTGP
ncbi:MAG TPA: hypothetical protein VFP26_10545 [Gemmatimonadaceae bacterium]|nr:hypothetical protein [Gemmatimonadaceae bacterium]